MLNQTEVGQEWLFMAKHGLRENVHRLWICIIPNSPQSQIYQSSNLLVGLSRSSVQEARFFWKLFDSHLPALRKTTPYPVIMDAWKLHLYKCKSAHSQGTRALESRVTFICFGITRCVKFDSPQFYQLSTMGFLLFGWISHISITWRVQQGDCYTYKCCTQWRKQSLEPSLMTLYLLFSHSLKYHSYPLKGINEIICMHVCLCEILNIPHNHTRGWTYTNTYVYMKPIYHL